jgi:lipid II:glycine glycyltransferase (peptidoglycan interpeptide bridge formation enzyme)
VNVHVLPKPVTDLLTTRLLQQTTFWSRVKRRLGWNALAFDIEADGAPSGDALLLIHDVGGDRCIAYSPFGPELLPESERRGEYLAALSSELGAHLGSSCIFVRWDLPWSSPYAEEEDRFDEEGHWLGPPETRLRELRMNWGVTEVGLRKAPTDILPPDTIIVDLKKKEDEILARMKPKTRYNIGLAARRSVSVRIGGPSDLSLWMDLYGQTARRNNIVFHGKAHFEALMDRNSPDTRVQLLIAEKRKSPLAAMFLSISADRATYLYGASSDEGRSLMAPYAIQWAAIKKARQAGCTSYDLFGVAPRPDPEHPLYGLYRFKSGFGGALLHRQGTWDYPYDQEAYKVFCARESASTGFHL